MSRTEAQTTKKVLYQIICLAEKNGTRTKKLNQKKKNPTPLWYFQVPGFGAPVIETSEERANHHHE